MARVKETGLPLIYHHEIGHLLGTEVEAKPMPAGTPKASMDAIVAAGVGWLFDMFIFARLRRRGQRHRDGDRDLQHEDRDLVGLAEDVGHEHDAVAERAGRQRDRHPGACRRSVHRGDGQLPFASMGRRSRHDDAVVGDCGIGVVRLSNVARMAAQSAPPSSLPSRGAA